VRRRTLLIALVVALTGCALRGARRDPVARRLRRLDARFERRADPAELAAAVSGYVELDSETGDDARVLGRLARAYLVLGMAEPERSREHWQVAREAAMRCLLIGSGFSGRFTAAGGRLVPAAARRVPEAHAGCAIWGGLAWARQVELRGAGGVALDLESLGALAQRGEQIARSPEEKAAAAHLRGLVAALPPDALGPDLDAAAAALEVAAGARLEARVDLARHVEARTGDVSAATASLDAVLSTEPPGAGWIPEDAWALQQAAIALNALR